LLEEYRRLRPFHEVPEALQRLATHFELCLMSNSERDVITANVRALPTDFASVFTAEDVGCYKPDLRFFRIVADRLHFDDPLIKHVHVAAGFWYDVIPAATLGWKRIWVNRNHAKGDERYRPYGEAANLSSAAELIEKTIA
jgi:2-haloacid dehalogenase